MYIFMLSSNLNSLFQEHVDLKYDQVLFHCNDLALDSCR